MTLFGATEVGTAITTPAMISNIPFDKRTDPINTRALVGAAAKIYGLAEPVAAIYIASNTATV
ncbi:hypothetical protein MGH68_03950 [Erysipelothrix sp. D19-032]